MYTSYMYTSIISTLLWVTEVILRTYIRPVYEDLYPLALMRTAPLLHIIPPESKFLVLELLYKGRYYLLLH